MFLHLNYTMEIIGRAESVQHEEEAEEKRRSGGQLVRRAQRSKAQSMTLGGLFSLGKMYHNRYYLQSSGV